MSSGYAVFYCQQHVLTLRTNILLLSNFYRDIIYVSINRTSATIRLKGNDAINLMTTVIVSSAKSTHVGVEISRSFHALGN